MTYNNPLSAFDSIFGEAFDAFAPLLEAHRPRTECSLEWFEDDANYFARLDLPGVNKENLNLVVESDVISLSMTGSNEGSSHERKLRVPENVEADGLTAKLEDGVLTLTFRKSPERVPVSIEVA